MTLTFNRDRDLDLRSEYFAISSGRSISFNGLYFFRAKVITGWSLNAPILDL